MEQIREEARRRLQELRKIRFAQPTARELRSDKSMLNRVHRQEMQRYEQDVTKQKTKLIQDISNIDTYLQSVNETNKKKLPMRSPTKDMKPIPRGLQKRTPVILPKPNIVFGIKPQFRGTRLSRYRRGR